VPPLDVGPERSCPWKPAPGRQRREKQHHAHREILVIASNATTIICLRAQRRLDLLGDETIHDPTRADEPRHSIDREPVCREAPQRLPLRQGLSRSKIFGSTASISGR
jgi:hypothetical protein